MQTVYVDIYFLINFTVDLIGLHLTSRFTKTPVSAIRLFIGAIIGGIYAVTLVVIPKDAVLFSFVTVFAIFISVAICLSGIRFARKIKFVIAFLISEIIIGGAVYFIYGVLDRVSADTFGEEMEADRNLLLLAIIILFSVGALKLILSLFADTVVEKNVKLKIVFLKKEYTVDALVDSGNLLKDPMDLSPVMLVKSNFTKEIFPRGIPDFIKSDSLSKEIRRKIRVIPINDSAGCKIIYGIKPDSVMIVRKTKNEKINLTIAFDKEGGSYGGFNALIPAAALQGV